MQTDATAASSSDGHVAADTLTWRMPAALAPHDDAPAAAQDDNDDDDDVDVIYAALRNAYDALLRRRARWLRAARRRLDKLAQQQAQQQQQQAQQQQQQRTCSDVASPRQRQRASPHAAMTSLLSRLRARTAALRDEEAQLQDRLRRMRRGDGVIAAAVTSSSNNDDNKVDVSTMQARFAAHVSYREAALLCADEQRARVRLVACEAAARHDLVTTAHAPRTRQAAASAADVPCDGDKDDDAVTSTPLRAFVATLRGDTSLLRALARAVCAQGCSEPV